MRWNEIPWKWSEGEDFLCARAANKEGEYPL
jgi:hypothetical protein